MNSDRPFNEVPTVSRKRIITLKFTYSEADGLLNAGNRGVADLHDADGDEDHVAADNASRALRKLGQAMAEAWPEDD